MPKFRFSLPPRYKLIIYYCQLALMFIMRQANLLKRFNMIFLNQCKRIRPTSNPFDISDTRAPVGRNTEHTQKNEKRFWFKEVQR